MKKLSLIVLLGVFVIAVFCFMGYSQISNKPVLNKKAVWKITLATSDPSCYKQVPLSPTHAIPPAIFKLKFEFKASAGLLPPGDLIVTGKLVSSLDTGAKPPINLSALAVGWADGTTNVIVWDKDKFLLTKVNKRDFILAYDGLQIKAGTTGDVFIYITAESKDAGGVYYTDKKTLIIKPCPIKLIPVS
jgi:hypothetical protein